MTENRNKNTTPVPRTLKPGLVRILAFLGVISVMIFVFIAIASVNAMRQITSLAKDARDNVLPLVTENQRTAINLERLGKFGESIMTSSERNRRRELRLSAQMLSNDAIYEKNEKVVGVIRNAFQSIRKISAGKDRQDIASEKVRERIAELDAMIAIAKEAANRMTHSDENHENWGALIEKLLTLRLDLSDISLKQSSWDPNDLRVQVSGIDIVSGNLSGDIAPELAEKLSSLNQRVQEISALWESIKTTDGENEELWSNTRSELGELSNSLSLSAAVTASERFTDIAASAFRVMKIGILGIAVVAAMAIFITFLVHYYVIIPIIRATEGLERIHLEGKSVTLPSTLLKEPDEILRAVEQLGDVVENLKTVQEELHQKNIRLRETNSKLQEANQQIMSSIRYAEMIQSSLLPNQDLLKRNLPKSFVIWMPKDIVGGDVVFIDFIDDGYIVAVMDCTGHGVPGALMAMVAFTSLERIIRGESSRNPAEILKRLNFLIKKILKQDMEHTASDDGVDAAVCVVQESASGVQTSDIAGQADSAGHRVLTYAGARIPLAIIHNGEIKIVKGDRQSLGYKRSDLNFNYTNHVFRLDNGTAFYMYSDGFADQIGVKTNRKFGSRQFRDLLETIAGHPFHEQRDMLISAFNDHKGEEARRDDVTIVGFGL